MFLLESGAIERLASMRMQCKGCGRSLDAEAHEEHATFGCKKAERRLRSSWLGG